MKSSSPSQIPCVVTAGDARAAKAVYGDNKAFLPIAGRAMLARVVVTLQEVPEISEVWVVGNRERLAGLFAAPDLKAEIHKPLYLVEQGRSLLENAWESFRRIVSRDPENGRDPEGDEIDQEVLYLSGDLPFATPQEISAFARTCLDLEECDYAFGFVTEEALAAFRPSETGEAGIEVAYFNLLEGRVRQNNMHFARPARVGNRDRIEEMYEHRHQKQFWNMAVMLWKIFFARGGGPTIVLLYLMMHVAGLADRWRLRRLSDRLRGWVSLSRNESVISRILDARFRLIATEAGGCGIDVDTEEEYDVVQERFEEWSRAQYARAEALYGPLPSARPSAIGGES